MSNNNKQVLSVSEPSICIPRVFENIEKKVIWGVFTNLFGSESIDRIDIVYKNDSRGEKFKRVFVHFKAWPSTYESQLVRRKLIEGKEVKIVYDEPWYWKCTASRIEKPATRERIVREPYVDLSDSNTTTSRAAAAASSSSDEEDVQERVRNPRSEPRSEPRQRISTSSIKFVPRQILKRSHS